MSTGPKPTIVIVEDENDLANVIATHLEVSGMRSQICNSAGHAIRFLQSNFANLLLLDLNLPDSNGFKLMEDLREHKIHVPVIFLTGEHAEINKIKGLEMGGDDYITKPFSYAELIARIKAVLRRTEVVDDDKITQNTTISDKPFLFCSAEVNPKRLEITFPSGAIESIGRKELGIFSYLASNPNTVLTRKNMIHAVWGIHADVRSRSLDQYIVKIRELYKRHNVSLDPFKTIHGVGYMYDTQNQDNGSAEQ